MISHLRDGHKCGSKGKQLFLVKVVDEDGDEIEKVEGLEPVIGEVEHQISMNFVCGNIGFQTMRINGHLGKKTIHIVIDFGSTHNFLDENLSLIHI